MLESPKFRKRKSKLVRTRTGNERMVFLGQGIPLKGFPCL